METRWTLKILPIFSRFSGELLQIIICWYLLFSVRLRKDVQKLFVAHSVCSKKLNLIRGGDKKNEGFNEEHCNNSGTLEHKLENMWFNWVIPGFITRNNQRDLARFHAKTEKKRIYDAMAVASILNNSSGKNWLNWLYLQLFTLGLDTSKERVLPADAFLNFLTYYQGDILLPDDVIKLIKTHEPNPDLRSRNLLSFEGFTRYLMDRDNDAVANDLVDEEAMDQPLAHYYIASSHNTYLTGHQLKGQSSVELYRQVNWLNK